MPLARRSSGSPRPNRSEDERVCVNYHLQALHAFHPTIGCTSRVVRLSHLEVPTGVAVALFQDEPEPVTPLLRPSATAGGLPHLVHFIGLPPIAGHPNGWTVFPRQPAVSVEKEPVEVVVAPFDGTLVEIPLDVELRDPVMIPTYQEISAARSAPRGSGSFGQISSVCLVLPSVNAALYWLCFGL